MTAKREYSFDTACYELAEHFFRGAPEPLLNELAQRIQDQVESSPELEAWFEARVQEDMADRDRDDWERRQSREPR